MVKEMELNEALSLQWMIRELQEGTTYRLNADGDMELRLDGQQFILRSQDDDGRWEEENIPDTTAIDLMIRRGRRLA